MIFAAPRKATSKESGENLGTQGESKLRFLFLLSIDAINKCLKDKLFLFVRHEWSVNILNNL